MICRFAYVQIFSAFIVSKAAEQSLVERVRKLHVVLVNANSIQNGQAF